jgi:hypothetical protein
MKIFFIVWSIVSVAVNVWAFIHYKKTLKEELEKNQ